MMDFSNQVDISKETRNDILILRIKGRLDHTQTAMVQPELLNIIHDGSKRVILNLSGINYISSAGLRMLFAVEDEVIHQSGKLVMCVPSQSVKEIFDISGASKRLQLFQEETEAVNSLLKT